MAKALFPDSAGKWAKIANLPSDLMQGPMWLTIGFVAAAGAMVLGVLGLAAGITSGWAFAIFPSSILLVLGFLALRSLQWIYSITR